MPAPATMTRALVASVAAVLVLLATAAPSAAATPCWRQVLNDWSDNGRVDGRYADSCYEQALRNLPTDVRIYSDAADAIAAARDRRLRENARRPSLRPGDDAGSGSAGSGAARDSGGDGDGPIGAALNAGQSAVGDVPLPLLALAAIALLLVSAGGAGLLSRRLHARRAGTDEPAD